MAHQAHWRRGPLILVLAVALAACTNRERRVATEEEINAFPADYRTDIVGAMHAYLNDPTKIRDAGISEPALKTVASGGSTEAATKRSRYVVCVRFNARKGGNEYAGTKEVAAVFLAGHFDQFLEASREPCAAATYAPFPELEKLAR
jgi:hypothetical protein